MCNTLVTTEHKHYDSVYSVNELHKKNCVNGVACAGILESFAVDGISFKVAAAMGEEGEFARENYIGISVDTLELQRYGFYREDKLL